MAQIDFPIRVDLAPVRAQLEAAAASAAALSAAADGIPESVRDELCRRVTHGGVLLDDADNLFRCESIGGAASGATELQGFQIAPSDRYLELVSAVAAHGNAHVSRVAHGWPILSQSEASTPTVTEAGGAHNAPGGGAA